ncbi:MAG: CPBP family intramembrane glutamic endopeptidase [Oscillospiraceae bacterium]
MSSKSLTIKRIIIFCVIAFVPFWIIVPIMNAVFGAPIYECESAAGAVYALGVFGMLIPAAANLITRLATKEGFKDSYLGLNFKGNAGYYVASVVVKLAEIAVVWLVIWALFATELSFREAFPFDGMSTRLGAFLLQLSASIIVFFPAFGEEWGWRGYLMPKLTEVMGKPAAVIVGGIIWGLWHAPLTLAGHNFGTGYDFYPWGGILIMCVMCTLMNAFLTLLTERTKSIYPASFCHMINNNLGGSVFVIIFGSEAFAAKTAELSAFSIMLRAYLPVLAVTGIVSFVLLLRNKEKA